MAPSIQWCGYRRIPASTAADHHATGWHHWSYRTVRLFLPIRKARR